MELEAALKKYDKTGMASWTWYLDDPGCTRAGSVGKALICDGGIAFK